MAVLLAALTGCSAQEPRPTQQVVVCFGTGTGTPNDGDVRFTFEQQGREVASGTAARDLALGVTVPAGRVTTVLADGQPFGEVGVDATVEDVAVDADGRTPGYYALTGPGCPDPALAVERPAAG